MANKKDYMEGQERYWIMFFLILIIIATAFFISYLDSRLDSLEEIHEPQYEYETLHIALNNTNDFSEVDGEIVEYLCDENVEFSNHGNSYYASTVTIDGFPLNWERRGYGECIIKIKEIKDVHVSGGDE